VSTPQEAIKKVLTRFEKMRRAFRSTRHHHHKHADGNISQNNFGWPGTHRLSNTYNPKWDGEEIHFKVRTHDENGLPIDLTGAMMHIAVFDGKSSSRLIGTFALNLAYLIVRSRHRNEQAAHTPSKASRVRVRRSSILEAVTRASLFGGATRMSVSKDGDRQRERNTGQEHDEDTQNQSRVLGLRDAVTAALSAFKGVSNRGDDAKFDTSQSDLKGTSSLVEQLPSEKEQKSAPSLASMNGVSGSTHPNYYMDQSISLRLLQLSNEQDPAADSEDQKVTDSVVTNGPSEALKNAMDSTSWFTRAFRKETKCKMKKDKSTRLSISPALESMNIQSLRLDKPLMKNGKEVGRIRCTIDSWWLSDKAASKKSKNEAGLGID
jgi:hypothetical protein